MDFQCGIRKFGITVQVILYSANGILWITSILSIVCGFVIGLANDTIDLTDLNKFDYLITTPATTFVVHGLLLTVVAIVGCFSSLTAKLLLSVIYVVLIIAYMIFDSFSGFEFLFRRDAILNFYRKLNESIYEYGGENAQGIGLFSIHPTLYWEHLQRRGKCCGIESFEDWRNAEFAKDKGHIPDSCCNANYDYRNCGNYAFRHPDLETHRINDLLHAKGCMNIFPEALRINSKSRVSQVGNFTAALLIICMLLSLVMIAMVSSRLFRPGDGLDVLDNPDTADVEDVKSYGSGESNDTLRPKHKRLSMDRRVHPEEFEESGSGGDNHRKRSTGNKVLFRESGPSFIHRNSESESDEDDDEKQKERRKSRFEDEEKEIRKIDSLSEVLIHAKK